MGKQQNNKKSRFNSEVIITIIVIWITIAFLLVMTFIKIDSNVKEYGKMRVPNIEAPKVTDIARERTDVQACAGIVADTEKEEVYLTQRQLVMQKSGLEPDESLVNWVLAEGIGSYVEYSVGNNANDFSGYDFDEVQQVTVKRIMNQLDSNAFPKDFYRLVIQDSGYSGWHYVCINHPRAKDNTMINVLKVLYHNADYDIPDNVYYQASFLYSENGETESNQGEVVSDPYEAFDLLCQKGLSDSLYPYSSYIYFDSSGARKLLIFCGSF